jgi:hypothetical protein
VETGKFKDIKGSGTYQGKVTSLYDEILRELAFARMIDRGSADSQENRTISNNEMKKKFKHGKDKLDS